jgi:hypothetical protein
MKNETKPTLNKKIVEDYLQNDLARKVVKIKTDVS